VECIELIIIHHWDFKRLESLRRTDGNVCHLRDQWSEKSNVCRRW